MQNPTLIRLMAWYVVTDLKTSILMSDFYVSFPVHLTSPYPSPWIIPARYPLHIFTDLYNLWQRCRSN